MRSTPRTAPRRRLESAKRALFASQAQIAVVDAQKKSIDIQIDKTEVKAPADGLVLARNATLGGIVSSSGGALFRLAIDNEFELSADVAETALPRLAEGMPSAISVAGWGAPVDGKIRLIGPEVNQASRLGMIRITLPSNPVPRVGNFGRAEIETVRRRAVAVPASAVIYADADAFLQKVENGRVKTVPVKLGARADGYVEVVSRHRRRRRSGVARRHLRRRRRHGHAGARRADGSDPLMGWNFSAWAIRNPVPPILMFIVLMALGLMSFSKLPVTRFPNIDVPIVSVTVTDPGVAPSELETQVTKRVEDAVANISGVKNVTSTITEGSSQTVIEFRLEVDTQTAVNDTKDAVERIRSDLPATSEAPVVNRVDVEGQAILTYAVSAPAMTIEELSWFVDDTVIRKLQGLKGVARVDRYGGVTREIKVELDPDRLNALGVTASDVNRALRSANVDMTGGSADFAGRDQAIRTLGGAKKIADLRGAGDPAGQRPPRHAVGNRQRSPMPGRSRRAFARVNNQTVVSFGIFRGKGQSDVDVNQPRRGGGRRAAGGASRRVDQQGRQLGRLHRRQLRFGDGDAARGRRPFGDRGADLPARHPRDAGLGDRAAAVDHPRLLGDRHDGLLAQPGQPARHHAGGRHPGRRRHRRDREHRAPHQDGQDAVSGGARSGRRDRPCRHRDLRDHHGGVRAGLLHGRHRRPVLQAVRPDRGGRGVLLAAGGAPADADAGRLFPARPRPCRAEARHDHARLSAGC